MTSSGQTSKLFFGPNSSLVWLRHCFHEMNNAKFRAYFLIHYLSCDAQLICCNDALNFRKCKGRCLCVPI